jgi:excinuclease ABC subunit B
MDTPFQLVSPYSPTGAPPEAVAQIAANLEQGVRAQVLLGSPCSGKTFTMPRGRGRAAAGAGARPQQTLAAQLYNEVPPAPSRTTRGNTSCPTTTTTSPRPTCRHADL